MRKNDRKVFKFVETQIFAKSFVLVLGLVLSFGKRLTVFTVYTCSRDFRGEYYFTTFKNFLRTLKLKKFYVYKNHNIFYFILLH